MRFGAGGHRSERCTAGESGSCRLTVVLQSAGAIPFAPTDTAPVEVLIAKSVLPVGSTRFQVIGLPSPPVTAGVKTS